ncbi:MAG: hypothetical protein KF889_23655 [Alphaproteobacteria bacterium]|nr:hypothetical protein [Alphaproteobacteria bacterium]MCW5742836.1 hypothetical protein [Alphaproteobacteria bacterium]
MTASRASAVVATLVGCVLSWGAVQAQDTPQRHVMPPSAPSNPLDRIGLVDTRSAGVPGWTWHGTSMAEARALVLGLPSAPQSRVLRDLQFRLLTAGPAPPRPDGALPLLFSLRVEKLAAMGEAENAHELLRLGSGGEGPMTAQIVTEALMRARQRDSACGRVKAAVEHIDKTWWRQAAVVCHLHARRNEAARAGLDALRGQGDAGFIALADRILNGATAPSVSPTEDGLILALIDIAGLPTPLTGSDSPGVLRAAIENRAIPLAHRVEIAERAERAGVTEPDRLAEFYGELSRGLKESAATSPTAWRAVVFAQAQGAASNEQRVILAHRLYQVSYDTAGSAIRALSPAIAAARPTPAHAEFAAAGLRAVLTLERFDRAAEWFAAARAGAAQQTDDRVALLAPLAAIAGLGNRVPLDPELMQRRAALRPRTAPTLHAVLSAMNAASRDALASLAPSAAEDTSDPAIAALLAAAQAERFAETICRAAALAGSTPLASLEPAKVAAILRAFMRIKRVDLARSFALEYAILAGL